MTFFSSAGLFAGLAGHLYGFVVQFQGRGDLPGFIFCLGAALFVLVIPSIIRQQSIRTQRIGVDENWRSPGPEERLLRTNTPRGLEIVFKAISIYGLLWFAGLFLLLFRGTSELLPDGSYAIMNHGSFVRGSNYSEFQLHHRIIWLTFTAVYSTVYAYLARYYAFRPSTEEAVLNGQLPPRQLPRIPTVHRRPRHQIPESR